MPIRKTSRFLTADKDAVIVEIHRVAGLTDSILTREFLFKNSEITRQVLKKLFGSFEKAIEAAGLPTYRVSTDKYSREDILNKIRELSKISGIIPSQYEFLHASNVPRSSIITLFSTYTIG